MSYIKTNWNNDTAPAINATNLNKIEQGIYDLDAKDDIIVSPTQPVTDEKVWFKKGKNLYDPSINEGTYTYSGGQTQYTVANDGKITQSTSDSSLFSSVAKRSFYLEAGTYTMSIVGKDSDITLQMYNITDSSNVFFGTENSYTFTLPGKKMVAIKTYGNASSNYPQEYYVQLEKGNTATTYEQYVTPSIFVNNDEIYNQKNWDGFENRLMEENTYDTWIPVMKDRTLQHTTIANIVSRGNEATTSQKGLMSASDKTKLNNFDNSVTITYITNSNMGSAYWANQVNYIKFGKIAFFYVIINLRTKNASATNEEAYFELPFTIKNNWYFPLIKANYSTEQNIYLTGAGGTKRIYLTKNNNRDRYKVDELPNSGYIVDTQFFALLD